MKPNFRYFLGIVLCGSLAQFAQAAGAGAGQSGELPVVVGTGSLTVAGQGYWHREVYEGGESPSLSAYDNNGAVLPDGVYRYEFRSVPDSAGASHRQKSLTKAEGNSEGASLRRGNAKGVNTVSGLFEIQDGQIIYR